MPKQDPGIPIVPTASRVVVVRNGQLDIINAHGAHMGLVAKVDATWCTVDPRAGVLWFTVADQDAESLSLGFVDLENPNFPTQVVAVGLAPNVPVGVVYPDESLGVPEPHRYQVVTAIQPMENLIGPQIGCDGDMQFYCYGDEGPEENADVADGLSPDTQEAYDAASAVEILDEAVLDAIAERAGARTLWPDWAPAGDVPERLDNTVPASQCLDAGACGAVQALPGTELWAVTVATDRGDFFHETQQLYDPKTQEFFDPRTGKRGVAPLPETALDAEFVVAPGGDAYATDATVVHFVNGVVLEDLVVCGWLGGGQAYAYPG